MAQVDFVQVLDTEYAQMIFHPETKTHNLSYNYSSKWDFDGDGKKDSLYFIGNGGAPTYYFLRLILSSDNKIRDFRDLEIDRPNFVESKNVLKQNKEDVGPQFVVFDFDMDGISEIYLNIDQPYYKPTKSLKRLDIKGPKLLFDFTKNNLLLKDYKSVE